MKSRLISLLLLCFYFTKVYAVDVDRVIPDTEVVAQRGSSKLTLRDIDVVLESVPAVDRSGVVASSDRLQHILDSELLNKQIAQRGREMKLMESPMIQQQVARAAEQAFAKITIDQIVKDAKRPDFAMVAKEYYMANRSEFATPVSSVVQHILISKTDRTAAEILARVQEVYKKAQTPGANFELLVIEYSDDTSKSDNKGVMTVANPGQFVPAFESAAHALKKTGDLVQVDTEYGTHILRLVARNPAGMKSFESVREEIIAKLTDEFEGGIRTKLFSDLRSANPVFHEDMIQAVSKRYGELKKIDTQLVSPPPAVDGTK